MWWRAEDILKSQFTDLVLFSAERGRSCRSRSPPPAVPAVTDISTRRRLSCAISTWSAWTEWRRPGSAAPEWSGPRPSWPAPPLVRVAGRNVSGPWWPSTPVPHPRDLSGLVTTTVTPTRRTVGLSIFVSPVDSSTRPPVTR